MKQLLCILALFAAWGFRAQSVSPQVINAAGAHRTMANGASVTDNIGEPFTETLGPSSNMVLTQGFLQPIVVGSPSFTLTIFKNDVSCSDKDDGRISSALTTAFSGGYQVSYHWSVPALCPGNNCPTIDSLPRGNYGLKVIVSYVTVAGMKKDTIADTTIAVSDLNGPCKVKIYNGVSIDGGLNSHFHIDNISEFPNNRLTIYNRWGGKLYDENGYDNTTKFWPSTDELSRLLPSTYFYVLDLGDGSKPIKGWIELVKNQ